jgi:membrane protease YdiL (CAAX protease family)
MATQDDRRGLWMKLPFWLRAIVSGLLIGLVAANVWPVLLITLGVALGAAVEILFLMLYLWWASGGGPARSSQASRASSFRRSSLTGRQWLWALIAAVFFTVTVHAAVVLLFRFVPFPLAAFRRGYDLSLVPTVPLKWLVVMVSAMSAGICEETGFRGYMQRPLETRYSPRAAILISAFFFTIVHLNKGWELAGMVLITFMGGILLGLIAWSSGSLIPGMIGHVLMDIGLFAYWWTGLAGTFMARPISETGVDGSFLLTCAALAVSLSTVLLAIRKFRKQVQAGPGQQLASQVSV